MERWTIFIARLILGSIATSAYVVVMFGTFDLYSKGLPYQLINGALMAVMVFPWIDRWRPNPATSVASPNAISTKTTDRT